MTSLQAGLRGGAIALLVVLAVAGARGAREQPSERYAVLFDLCAIAYLLESAPELSRAGAIWMAPLTLLSNAAAAAFQLWASAGFSDEFVARPVRWIPFALIVVLTLAAIVTGASVVWQVVHAAALTLVAVGIVTVLRGRRADLVEHRRRARLVFACGVGAVIILNTVLAVTGTPEQPAIGAVAGLALAAALLRLRTAGGQPAPAASVLAASPPEAGSGDADVLALAHRIQAVMDGERAYRDPELTVASLAEQVGSPEYRVRRAINGTLGQRNFVAFVNGYRLAGTKSALADPAQARVPVLTIALDAGFGSIGPFNRAFKAETGETPTEYRRRALAACGSPIAQSASNSRNRPPPGA